MKVVIAPDSFKECLPASQVAAALAAGVLDAAPDAQIDVCPLADGGEGTSEAMVRATGGRFIAADVFGPLGQPLRARFGILGPVRAAGLPGQIGVLGAIGDGDLPDRDVPAEGATAVIEMAAAAGLSLVSPEQRDPMRTTTYGVGMLVAAALDAGVGEIIVALGGSATVDGGAGCAQALGAEFLDARGRPCVSGLSGGRLKEIDRIDASGRDVRLDETPVRAACDVTNPLTGSNGAAAVYAPQKGATPEMVADLEAGLLRYAELIRRDVGVDVQKLPGAGAAGGLGAGLAAFAGAELTAGVETVAAAVALTRRLSGADLCITGEGALDASSGSGKTTVGVADIAARAGVPVVCIAGQVAADAPADRFARVLSLSGEGISVRQAIHRAGELLRLRAAQAVRI